MEFYTISISYFFCCLIFSGASQSTASRSTNETVDKALHSPSGEVERTSASNRDTADNVRPADDTHDSVPKPGPDPPTTTRHGDVLKQAVGPDGDSASRASKSQPKSPQPEADLGKKEPHTPKNWIPEGKEVPPPAPDYNGIKPATLQSPKPVAGNPEGKESQPPKTWIPEEKAFPPPPPDYQGIKPAYPESANTKAADAAEKRSQTPKKWIPEKRETLPLPPDYKGHRYGPRAVAARQRYLQARLNPKPPTPAPKPQVSSVRISRNYTETHTRCIS